MSPSPRGRVQACGNDDARARLAHARAFADTAEVVLDIEDDASLNVASSLAILAGIAASDAACCATLGKRPRGQDHRDAITLLTSVAGRGPEMGKDLARLLDLKDNAHYGVLYVSETKARQAVRWARRMVTAAEACVLR
jgi:hypothetical protein